MGFVFVREKTIIITISFQKKKLMSQITYQTKYAKTKVIEFYNKSVKSWLQDNGMEMHSTHNEGKSVVGISIRSLKNKLYKYIINIKKVCISYI